MCYNSVTIHNIICITFSTTHYCTFPLDVPKLISMPDYHAEHYLYVSIEVVNMISYIDLIRFFTLK